MIRHRSEAAHRGRRDLRGHRRTVPGTAFSQRVLNRRKALGLLRSGRAVCNAVQRLCPPARAVLLRRTALAGGSLARIADSVPGVGHVERAQRTTRPAVMKAHPPQDRCAATSLVWRSAHSRGLRRIGRVRPSPP